MRATDELRRLLDERGVEYKIVPESFYMRESIMVGDTEILFNDRGEVAVHGITPEQAIEATLGRGTCSNTAPSYLDFMCSECGFVHYHSDANDSGDGNEWRYCPNCGRKVRA